MAKQELSVPQKADAILRRIVELVNTGIGDDPAKDVQVCFSPDWGGNGVTLSITGQGRTHCGFQDSTWEQFIDSLYNALHDGAAGVMLGLKGTQWT
jgi:hypothetical protein